jgi:trehalose 6-phosphate phosphatase
VPIGPDATEIIRSTLAVRPCGLMTDIDGTISRIAHHPDAATVDPDARIALDALASRIDVVAAISGRSAMDARSMVGLDSLVYSGNHGMEIWSNGRLEQSSAANVYVERVGELLRKLERKIDVEGVYFENKRLTGSIHVRETSDPVEAERVILEQAKRLADELDLRVTRGRMVIEIRPPIDLNKGTSVNDLIVRYDLESAVYLGDDVTDVDAFRALRRFRESREKPYYAIGVTGPETPEEVIDHADVLVDGVDGVTEFLNRFVDMANAFPN